MARGSLFPICSGVKPLDLDTLSRTELIALVEAQGAELLALKASVEQLRAEIARLKGTPPRPTLKPSGMDKGTDPVRPAPAGQFQRRGKFWIVGTSVGRLAREIVGRVVAHGN